MKCTVTARLEDGDRLYCCPHTDGSLSIMAGHCDERIALQVQYAALDVTVAKIQAGVAKAKALRALDHPETPPCELTEPDSPAAAPSPAAHQSTTEPDGPAQAGSSG